MRLAVCLLLQLDKYLDYKTASLFRITIGSLSAGYFAAIFLIFLSTFDITNSSILIITFSTRMSFCN